MDDIGVIGEMTGVAVHDGWKPYRPYDVAHALCNAHHLRELDGVGVGWDQGWANELVDLLVEAKRDRRDGRAERGRPARRRHAPLDPGPLRTARGQGLRRQPRTRRSASVGYEKKAANLLVRLDPIGPTCCASPPTSPALRQQPGRTRHPDGEAPAEDLGIVADARRRRHFCAIRSYISTMRKHDDDVLGGLRQLFEGQVWLPGGT